MKHLTDNSLTSDNFLAISSLKIIHLVLGKANPERLNGVNRMVHQLATALCENHVETEVWGITDSPSKPVYERSFRTRLFAKTSWNKKPDLQLINSIEELSHNAIVHIHGAFIYDFYKVSSLLIKNNIPYIYTPHGAFTAKAFKKNRLMKSIYFYLFERKIIRHAYAIHLLSETEELFARQISPTSNSIVIPNGIVVNETTSIKEKHLINNQPVFCFMGRLDIYYKGLDILVNAFARYIKQGGKGKLYMAGEGPDREKLQKLIMRRKMSDYIFLTGALFGLEKNDLLKRADVFCHPSRSEGFAMGVLEAAVAGLPLLISKECNLRGKVEQSECGIELRRNTPAELCSAMHCFHALYAEGKIVEMGNNARQMVVNNFNIDHICRQFVLLYYKSVGVTI